MFTPVHTAARFGFSDCLCLLLRHGGHAIPRNKYGKTPLDYAQKFDHDECVEILERWAAGDRSVAEAPAAEASAAEVPAAAGRRPCWVLVGVL